MARLLSKDRTPEAVKQLTNEYLEGARKLFQWELELKYDGKQKPDKELREEYLWLKINYPISPGYFRDSYLRIPKSTISRWKTGTDKQQELWNLIQNGVAFLTGLMEVQLLNETNPAKVNAKLKSLSAWNSARWNEKVAVVNQMRSLDTGEESVPVQFIGLTNDSKLNLMKYIPKEEANVNKE